MNRLGVFAAMVILASCKDSPGTPEAGPAPVEAAATASSSVAPVPTASAPPVSDAGKAHGCTAIGVKGSVGEPDGGAVTDAMKVQGKTLAIADGAKITVKGVTTGKETAFIGPGKAIVCRDGDEDEHWLLTGAAEVTTGAPGGETWLVVPGFAVLRYAGAAVRAEVSDKVLSVTVRSGLAYALPIGGGPMTDASPSSVDESGFLRIDGGQTVTFPKSTAAAKAGVDKCVQAANDAHALATAIIAPDANVGTLAAKHVDARKKARALCTVALATPGLSGSEKTRAEAADAAWRQVLTP